jgi:Undecaprenyl-phosphate glucose phosphotransferase
MPLAGHEGFVTATIMSELHTSAPEAFTWVDRQTKASAHSGAVSYASLGFLVAVTDFLLIIVLSEFAALSYQFLILGNGGDLGAFAGIGLVTAFSFVVLMKARGLYQPQSLLSARKQIEGVVVGWLIALSLLASLFFLLKVGGNFSRGSTAAFGAATLLALVGLRALLAAWVQKALDKGWVAKGRVLVLGDPAELARSDFMHALDHAAVTEAARLALLEQGELTSKEAEVRDRETIDEAIRLARSADIDQIFLALHWNDVRWRSVAERLRILPIPVFLLPDSATKAIFERPVREVGSTTVVELQRAPLSASELIAKRAIDIILASFALVALSPLLLLVILAIKLDSRGPVLFRQYRNGFNGRRFSIYKFRTMYVLENGVSIKQAQRNDPRLTRVGRVLRITSIDELPQLFNVLNGEMSLVGPRPHAVAHDDEYVTKVANYAFRHHVKPGITGLAQVRGLRGETRELVSMQKRIDLDLWYISNWSIWLDLRILARTMLVVMRGRNAY